VGKPARLDIRATRDVLGCREERGACAVFGILQDERMVLLLTQVNCGATAAKDVAARFLPATADPGGVAGGHHAP
jgi:hypothetical protein